MVAACPFGRVNAKRSAINAGAVASMNSYHATRRQLLRELQSPQVQGSLVRRELLILVYLSLALAALMARLVPSVESTIDPRFVPRVRHASTKEEKVLDGPLFFCDDIHDETVPILYEALEDAIRARLHAQDLG